VTISLLSVLLHTLATDVTTTNMRIPYAAETPADPTPENKAIYERIAARRNPRPLIPLDLALLHNPSIADGYNSLVGAIRTKSSLSEAIMELSICYIAVLTGAVYEWKAHSVLALKAGVSAEKLEKVLAKEKGWEGFDELENAVLEYTEESTVKISVSDEVFRRTRSLLGEDQKIMELQITIGAYNMVSRFLVGLDVTENNRGTMEVPVLEK
jgi:alkylhydroperoxidase family enzyme